MPEARDERGQALLLLVGVLCAVAVGALVLGSVARGLGVRGERQQAADLAALAGARAMHGAYERLFEPAVLDGLSNPRHLDRAAYVRLGARAAAVTARENGAREVEVVVGDGPSPTRITVHVRDPIATPGGEVESEVAATAELVPVAAAALGAAVSAAGGQYAGPLAQRQGKPMRPDVAMAFDRMAAAARADGVALIVNSGFRSDAEQAALFAARPDPKWVARPGTSLHRLGTELDLGPPAAYGWLARNATRFGFKQRYPWEPWHYGFVRSPSSGGVGLKYGGGDGARSRGVPGFVPQRFAPALSRAAQRWNVSAALLAAQLHAESGFNPFAVSPAGARGIAQFMPGTARQYGLDDPFDAAKAIDAQGHLMHDLLRQFASVPLALAAYNAGPAPVQRCGCVPPYPETRAYVARILGLLGGAGEAVDGTLEVRLVR